ncbi:hypothetical protein AAEO56_13890 [Flavobacterium sp. DGU11]|uniref:Uncharacterized protein n=1 Tax=Flavobacterium arundinis TaxID=3139143 RepID=A0ABU9I0C2_9FLAO
MQIRSLGGFVFYKNIYIWPSDNQIICTDVIVTDVGSDFKISHVALTGL